MKLNSASLLLIYLLSVFFSCRDNSAAKHIVFEESVKDVGKVMPGDSITVSFSFSNMLTRSIVVDTVIPDCSCTVFDYNRNVIEPGEKGDIKLKYRNYSDSGLFQKSAVVKFKDDTTAYIITMAGNKGR